MCVFIIVDYFSEFNMVELDSQLCISTGAVSDTGVSPTSLQACAAIPQPSQLWTITYIHGKHPVNYNTCMFFVIMWIFVPIRNNETIIPTSLSIRTISTILHITLYVILLIFIQCYIQIFIY